MSGTKKIRIIKYLTVLAFCVCCGFFHQPGPAWGDSKDSQNMKIILEYNVSGTKFCAYRVADVSDSGEITVYSTYETCMKDFRISDGESVRNAAEMLEKYVGEHDVEPDREGTMGEGGTLIFNNMEKGLYLITGEESAVDNVVYTPASSLVRLPEWDTQGNTQYQVTVKVKYSQNTWETTWENGSEETTAQESDTDESSSEENVEYLIEESESRMETATAVEDSRVSKKEAGLPQTGMLWWPVPVMASLGILLFVTGWRRHSIMRDENEK